MEDLGEVLKHLGGGAEDGVLVGMDAGDDAALVSVDGPDALVFTLDFFTPLVDDAYDWGRIAAANAVSDIYAMGGRPVFALNVVGWPSGDLPMDLLAEVLRGGADVAKQAGMAIVGGHTVDDPEPKYGMCVIGRVDPDASFTLDAAKPGDVLVLSKPIGTGIVTTAVKGGLASEDALKAAVASMTHLNAGAARAGTQVGVRACTDVTGFGLTGHLHRLLLASGVSAEVDPDALPLLPDVRELAERGAVPGGTQRNVDAVDRFVDWGEADEVGRLILADAQTSGGLLSACPPDRVEELVRALGDEPAAAVVGRVASGEGGRIRVRRGTV